MLRWLLARDGSLRRKVVRGGVWLTLGDGIARVLSVGKLIILGRLLSPHDFGLLGIALLALGWLEHFTESGFKTALVRKRGDIHEYLDTSWTVQILRAIALSIVVFAAAPLAARFFGAPEATPIIRAIALVTLLRGLTNPAVVYLRRELDFSREVAWHLGSAVVGVTVAVVLALAYRSVWALVVSVIAAQATEAVVSYWVRPYRPRLRIEWNRARELMRFGKWVFFGNGLGYIAAQLDSLVVGRVLGAGALGFYQMAQRLAFLPTSQVGRRARSVLLPAYARLATPGDRRRAFLKALVVVAAIVVPVGGFVSVFGEALVGLVLGERWLPMVPAFQILVWSGVVRAIVFTATPLTTAAGRPDLPLWGIMLRIGVLGAAIYPMSTALGLVGAALAATGASAVTGTYHLLCAMRLTRTRALEVAWALRAGVLGSLPFVAAGWLAPMTLSVGLFVVAGATLAASLAIVAALLHRQFGVSLGLSSTPGS